MQNVFVQPNAIHKVQVSGRTRILPALYFLAILAREIVLGINSAISILLGNRHFTRQLGIVQTNNKRYTHTHDDNNNKLDG